MEQQKGLFVRGPVTRVVLAVVIIAIGLGMAGCGRQMAKIDENQFKLQTMVESNAQQIAAIATRLEDNRQELRVMVETVQNDVANVAVDVAAVAKAQMKLHEAVESSSRQVTGEMAALEQNQHEMSASLGQAIAGVQSETRKVAAEVTTVTAKQVKLHEIVTAEQARLCETVQENNVQLNNKIAAMEQTQQERQNTIGGMQDNIQTVAVGISALGEDVLRLQEILQNNIRELVSIADITGKKQIEFQANMKKDIQTLDESLASLKLSQNTLQSRIEDMRNNAPDFSNVPAVLDELRDQVAELSRTGTAVEANEIEYESPPEANDIE